MEVLVHFTPFCRYEQIASCLVLARDLATKRYSLPDQFARSSQQPRFLVQYVTVTTPHEREPGAPSDVQKEAHSEVWCVVLLYRPQNRYDRQ